MVYNHSSSFTAIKRNAASKLALGSASLMMFALIGTTGVAGATSIASGEKPNKTECSLRHESTYGQCVRNWAHGRGHDNDGRGHGHGHGYGGDSDKPDTNNNVQTNVKVDQRNSDHNVVSTVINYMFG
jgi:hypothetical protein